MQLNQVLHNRQPNSQSGLRTLQRPIDLCKHVKDERKLLLGNPNAAVLHANNRLLGDLFDRQVNRSATIGELGGIVQKIADRLSEPGRVAS